MNYALVIDSLNTEIIAASLSAVLASSIVAIPLAAIKQLSMIRPTNRQLAASLVFAWGFPSTFQAATTFF
jgi:hypothetical protein